ncbi:hypothetical protein ACWCSH_01155, partial [Streptosporangium sp. NPDC001682]
MTPLQPSLSCGGADGLGVDKRVSSGLVRHTWPARNLRRAVWSRGHGVPTARVGPAAGSDRS